MKDNILLILAAAM